MDAARAWDVVDAARAARAGRVARAGRAARAGRVVRARAPAAPGRHGSWPAAGWCCSTCSPSGLM